MEILAAVVHQPKQEFQVEKVDLDQPQPDEVLVRIVATGLCHTDLVVRDGLLPYPPTPHVLGHEGAGVVAAVGSGVTKVAAGDHVALSFASCGACARCTSGMPAYCDNFGALNFMGRRADGSCTHHQNGKDINACFFGQSSFASHALVKARNVVKVPTDVPLEILGPLGCGVQTGAGTVMNHLKAEAGASLAVFGAGAVGLSAIMAARVQGCNPIIAVDIHPARLQFAKDVGATHIINGRETDAVKSIKDLTGGGAAYVVEATGVPEVMAQSIAAGRRLGDVVLVGAPPMTAKITLPVMDLIGGASIRSAIEGDSVPEVFIPQLIALYRAGKFPFDKMIKFYDLAEINAAVHDSETGATIKAVLRMPK